MTPGAFISKVAKSAQVRLARNIKLNAASSAMEEAVVSFSFDDFPRSALTEGGAMLRQAGWAGTYFTAGGFCGRTVDGLDYFDRGDLLQADAEGHELACHTFGHLRLPAERREIVLEDLEHNTDFLRQIVPRQPLTSFAYPYGDLDLGTKGLIAARYPVCRGIWPGLNVGKMDFAQLKAVPLEARSMDRLDVDSWLDRAVAAKAWLIFFTHDVSDAPSPYGCAKSAFASVIEKVAARRIKVLPINRAASFARTGA